MTDILKCKLCVGDAVFDANGHYWTCSFCGVYGPSDDASGEKWNRLMAPSVTEPSAPTVADLEAAFTSIRVRISHTIVTNQDLGFKLIDRLTRARRAAKAGRTQEAYAILTGEVE